MSVVVINKGPIDIIFQIRYPYPPNLIQDSRLVIAGESLSLDETEVRGAREIRIFTNGKCIWLGTIHLSSSHPLVIYPDIGIVTWSSIALTNNLRTEDSNITPVSEDPIPRREKDDGSSVLSRPYWSGVASVTRSLVDFPDGMSFPGVLFGIALLSSAYLLYSLCFA